MPGVVIFLQNAWSPLYAGGRWPRDSWIRALARSRSGQRLRLMLDDGFDSCENTTPEVGATASSKLPACPAHIKIILSTREPDVVIACGKQAEEALRKLWPLLVIPHPASRLVTDELFHEARRVLSARFRGRLALRQRRGSVERVEL